MAMHSSYLLPALIAVIFLWRFLKFRLSRKKVATLLSSGAVVVDVRSPSEFAAGSRKGTLNIPLNELEGRVSQLDHHKPVIVCCASGTRSAMAARILKRHGFERVLNAGAWTNVAG